MFQSQSYLNVPFVTLTRRSFPSPLDFRASLSLIFWEKKSQSILSQSAQKENICMKETSGSQTKEILGGQRTVLSLDKHDP